MSIIQNPIRTYNISEIHGYYKPIGRAFVSGTSLACDWTASGMELRARCSGDIIICLTSGTSYSPLTVVVDGVAVLENLDICEGTSSYTVATELSEGLHTVKLINTIGDGRCLSIDSISLFGELVKCEFEGKPYIEVVGDSITSGLGLGEHNGQLINNGLMAYAYHAIDKLNADYSICSISGMGIAFAANMDNIFSKVYPYRNIKRDNSLYLPTRTPDVVIVNLNTNDNWQWHIHGKGSDNGDYTMANFDAAFDGIIRTFEGQYGKDIPMLFVYGCMAHVDFTYGTKRAQELINTKYLNEGFNIKTVTLTTSRDGLGSHPSAQGAYIQGEELYQFLKANYPQLTK